MLLSETEKPSTPLLVGTPLPENLKDKFKLDDIVEKKLKKLMKKKWLDAFPIYNLFYQLIFIIEGWSFNLMKNKT